MMAWRRFFDALTLPFLKGRAVDKRAMAEDKRMRGSGFIAFDTTQILVDEYANA